MHLEALLPFKSQVRLLSQIPSLRRLSPEPIRMTVVLVCPESRPLYFGTDPYFYFGELPVLHSQSLLLKKGSLQIFGAKSGHVTRPDQ